MLKFIGGIYEEGNPEECELLKSKNTAKIN